MLYFYVSNRTENLLRMLGEVLRVDRQADPFASELFLIQSRGMERMIAQTMADFSSCFCNFKFFLPLDCIAFFARELGHGVNPDGFDRNALTWRLDGLLHDLEAPVMAPLGRYLGDDPDGVKRFQLARKIANLFDQYQLMRADMLAAWQAGQTVTSNGAELWQRELWLRLVTAIPGLRHRGIVLQSVMGQLATINSGGLVLPDRLSVFGLHSMPPLFLQFINALSRHLDVHFYLLSPCRQYWGDLPLRRERLDAFDLPAIAGENEIAHPLLACLGRQGRDFQRMLLDLAEIYREFKAYDDPLEDAAQPGGCLLHRIQADLLRGVVAAGSSQYGATGATQDSSLKIVSCYSKFRELQVLKDYLLDLLHCDPSLDLREIVVMAPDIQEYSALVPAVFDDIQHSIADRSMRGRNQVAGAFASFLDLLGSRFGWSEVMDFLRLPAVGSSFGFTGEDIEMVEKWVLGAGIRWGLSAEQRKQGGISPFSEVSWRAGLERMMMGFAIDSDDEIAGILPYGAIEGKEAEVLGGLCRFLDLLEAASRKTMSRYPLAGWVEHFSTWIEVLFGQLHDSDIHELRAALFDQAEVIGRFHDREISFAVVARWVAQLSGESRSSSGFLRGQLTFCSMLPMRSIPFKVVCLLGLDDGVFPKNDIRDTFDLMAENFRYGDRSARSDDRYQFLEAILAARNNLYLSFAGQSMVSHERIPPSVVVAEFLDLLKSVYGVRDMVVHHPLHPFSRKYFDPSQEASLFSYNQYYCQTAQALEQGEQPVLPWWRGRLDPPEKTIQLTQLLEFYRNPQKYFVQNRLGIKLNQALDVPDDRELFSISRLDRFRLRERMFQQVHRGGRLVDCRAMQQGGLWPLGNSGEIFFQEEEDAFQGVLAMTDALKCGKPLPARRIDLAAGPYRLIGTLDNLYENGVLLYRDGAIRGQDVLRAWIHHLALGSFDGDLFVRTALVAKDKILLFTGQAPGDALEKCLGYYDHGCQEPSCVFIDLAIIYVETLESGRKLPLEAVHARLADILEQKRQPEWELLFGAEPERFLDQRFVDYCENEFSGIWRAGKKEVAE